MNSSTQSDWTEYYKREEFNVPPFIINALWTNYEKIIRRHLGSPQSGLIVVELGGADSCFYQQFRKTFDVAEYHIIDNNQFGLDLFQHKEDKGTFLHNIDLLKGDPQKTGVRADIVFSAGLIEHFVPEDTEKIVQTHFGLAKSQGLVLMSFPTPTAVYWTFRRFLEKTGKFPPLFERPIRLTEVMPILRRFGVPLETYKIWKTILTQFLTLTRKS
jgi:hypothetical protein